jgi:hypothetical protein
MFLSEFFVLFNFHLKLAITLLNENCMSNIHFFNKKQYFDFNFYLKLAITLLYENCMSNMHAGTMTLSIDKIIDLS